MNAPSVDTEEQFRAPGGKRRALLRAGAFGVLALILVAFWAATSNSDFSKALPDALGGLLRLAGMGGAPSAGPPPARRAAAAPVRVGDVSRQDLPIIRRTPGTVIANTMVQVTSRVDGIIDSANFKEGQFVKKGDLLFQIDPRPFQAALQQSQAQAARDRAQLVSAQADADRAVMLAERGIVSAQQRDQLVATANALRATILADQAAINIAQLNVEYSTIRSPVNGKTGPILVQPGNLVQANSTTPIVTIAEIQPVKISFSLPQSDLTLILQRQREHALIAIADVKDARGQPISAQVDFVSNAVSDKSGTVELRASFANSDLNFLPGQLVNITVVLNKISNALVVPHDAVNDGPNGTYLYVVENGKARQRPVKVLFDDADNVAVLGNVKPGDKVIVEGQLRVNPGDAVNVLGPAPKISVNLGVSGLESEDQPDSGAAPSQP
jgi:multidrug efflux system membrane fusion protein